MGCFIFLFFFFFSSVVKSEKESDWLAIDRKEKSHLMITIGAFCRAFFAGRIYLVQYIC